MKKQITLITLCLSIVWCFTESVWTSGADLWIKWSVQGTVLIVVLVFWAAMESF